jgi:uncharacterized coiled-coil DUF342 family protein
VESLTDDVACRQNELTAKLKQELQDLVAQSRETSEGIAAVAIQLSHLQTQFADWNLNRSSDAVQAKFDAIITRVQLLEARCEHVGEIRSEARQVSSTLSTISEDVESLYSQVTVISKQVNATSAKLDAFRHHFEQLPD